MVGTNEMKLVISGLKHNIKENNTQVFKQVFIFVMSDFILYKNVFQKLYPFLNLESFGHQFHLPVCPSLLTQINQFID